MPPKYKLSYFVIRGRAEFLRFMLHYRQVDFEDCIVREAEWTTMKADYGTLPCLEWEHHRLSDSVAIAQYLGDALSLSGVSSLEASQCTQLAGMLNDCIYANIDEYIAAIVANDEGAATRTFNIFTANHLVAWLHNMEQWLVANGGDYFVGDQLTWADLLLAEKHHSFHAKSAKPFAKCPQLVAHFTKVYKLPGIEEYNATRHATPI